MIKIPVTVVVPVKNEELNLPRCLSRLSMFDEVVVVDSSSTDDTPRIVQNYGAKYINFEWDGRYPKKRNWFLKTHDVANKWVLFLDADEIVNEAFCNAVKEAIEDEVHRGYWINYANFFLGKRLRYGLKQRKLSLFEVGSGLYEYIEEDEWSHLDMEIHEHPEIDGAVGEINEPVEHNDYQGISKYIERHRCYALWESKRMVLLNNKPIDENEKLTERQKFKYANLSKWWFAWVYFAYTYIAKLGFIDGRAGFLYAYYKCWYFTTIRLLILEDKDRETKKL